MSNARFAGNVARGLLRTTAVTNEIHHDILSLITPDELDTALGYISRQSAADGRDLIFAPGQMGLLELLTPLDVHRDRVPVNDEVERLARIIMDDTTLQRQVLNSEGVREMVEDMLSHDAAYRARQARIPSYIGPESLPLNPSILRTTSHHTGMLRPSVRVPVRPISTFSSENGARAFVQPAVDDHSEHVGGRAGTSDTSSTRAARQAPDQHYQRPEMAQGMNSETEAAELLFQTFMADFQCPICHDAIVGSYECSCECNKLFCGACILGYFSRTHYRELPDGTHGLSCPCCNSGVTSVKPNINLDRAIHTMVTNIGDCPSRAEWLQRRDRWTEMVAENWHVKKLEKAFNRDRRGVVSSLLDGDADLTGAFADAAARNITQGVEWFQNLPQDIQDKTKRIGVFCTYLIVVVIARRIIGLQKL